MLRSTCQNAVVISTMLLSGENNKRLVTIITSLSVPMRRWHQRQNAELRSAAQTQAWVVAQVSGGW